MQNKVLRKLKLRLNPIGYKNTSEIETLLDINNKTQRKEFRPKIEFKIRELQTFENRRDDVSAELARVKDLLRKKQLEVDRVLAEVAAEKLNEAALRQGVESRFEDALQRYGKLELEAHNLTKAYSEQRQNNKLALELEQKRREKIDKEIAESVDHLKGTSY